MSQSSRPNLQAHYPVVIAGGGPTGLTLANLLGMYGVECLLIERHAATVHEPRAVSIDDESLRTMQAAGIGDRKQFDITTGLAKRLIFGRMMMTEHAGADDGSL